jgi:hypothetical protein
LARFPASASRDISELRQGKKKNILIIGADEGGWSQFPSTPSWYKRTKDLRNNKFTWKKKWQLCRSALIATLLTSLAYVIPLSMMRGYKSQGFIYIAKGAAKGTFTATGSGALIEIYGLFAVITFMWLTSVYYLFQNGKKIMKGEYDSAFPFKISNQQVKVIRKNAELGTVLSLCLEFPNGQQVTFSCLTERVASSLLNDFEVGEQASLAIKSEDGRDCDLIANESFAHGMIK